MAGLGLYPPANLLQFRVGVGPVLCDPSVSVSSCVGGVFVCLCVFGVGRVSLIRCVVVFREGSVPETTDGLVPGLSNA